MSRGSTTQPMARTPSINARTPLLSKSIYKAGSVARSTQSGAAASSQSAPATATDQSTSSAAPVTAAGAGFAGITSGYTHSAGSQDAVASQSAADNPPPEPTEEQLIEAVLTVGLRNDILEVITVAVNHWRVMAYFQDISIMGLTATGVPGCLTGPDLRASRVMASAYHTTDGLKREVMDMAMRGVGECFEIWQSAVTMPALPIFPAFAAFPGPYAPPMPSLPILLAMCPSFQSHHITNPSQMKAAMLDGAPRGLQSDKLADFFQNIAQCCATAFQMFTTSQMAVVTGQGPIPTFSHQTPVGPVMGGSILPQPGCFANSTAFSIPRLPLS